MHQKSKTRGGKAQRCSLRAFPICYGVKKAKCLLLGGGGVCGPPQKVIPTLTGKIEELSHLAEFFVARVQQVADRLIH